MTANIPSTTRIRQLRAIELEAIRVCAAFTALERNIENPSEWREFTKRVVELNARLEALLKCVGGPLDTEPPKHAPVNKRQLPLLPPRRPYKRPVLRRLPAPPKPTPLEEQHNEPSEE